MEIILVSSDSWPRDLRYMPRSTIGAFNFESHLTDWSINATLGFKPSIATATLAGVDSAYDPKGQLRREQLRPAQQFYSLAA